MEYILEHTGFALIRIFFTAAGILNYKKPEIVWFFTESWKSYNAEEPSDFYIKTARFTGVISIAAGIVIILVQVYLNIS